MKRSRLAVLVAHHLWQQRAALVFAAACLLCVSALELLTPWPLKIVFDHVLLGHPLPATLGFLQPLLQLGTWPALVLLACAIAAIALLGGAASYLQIFTTAKIGHRITWALRGALFAHLQRLSLAYHQQSRAGELLTKVASDTNLLRDAFADWALTFIAHGVTLGAMLVVMFLLDWRLALVVAVTLPPLLAAIFFLNRRVKASVREQRRHEGKMASRLNELLSSIALVQAFGRGSYEENRFQAEIAANYESGLRTARATGAIVRAVAVLSALGTAVVVLAGAHAVLGGRLTPGELLIFLAYVASVYKPVRDLGRLSTKMARASVSARRVSEILDIEPDADDAPDAIELHRPAGEIVFEHVTFAYPNGPRVLDDFSLRIAAGEHVVLLGASGAGKSTLLALLLRLYEPQAGRVLLDGVDIRRYTRASLRRAIGVVPQENVLFAVSVRENIAYGRPDAPQEAIEQAAQLARAHEFIVDLPSGYDTELAERASTLSGGQRQRLCLARALLKDPAILVLDEPTAAVDAASARAIHETVAHVFRDRTLVVVAHDVGNLHRYDRVLRLEAGQVVEQSMDAAEPAPSASTPTPAAARAPTLALVARHG